jgi:nucleotide-binding universal stress UspA family protein
MVNILVPTDFSDLSKVAIRYALKMAKNLNANVTILHVIIRIQPVRASVRFKLHSLELEMDKYAKEDLLELEEEVSKWNKAEIPVQYKIAKGSNFHDTVKSEAKKLRSGLIVMGTRGVSGLRKVVIGTNTTAVIERSTIPVLAIPELATHIGFKKIVYATDLMNIDGELKSLKPYLDIFNSSVHIVHVVDSDKKIDKARDIIRTAVQKFDEKKLKIDILVDKDIAKALDNYLLEKKVDLVCLFSRHHGFYDKLFNRSHTKKMAFQSKVPLLAFK